MTATATAAREQPKIAFDLTKREQFVPTKGYRQLYRRLKQFSTVDTHKDAIIAAKLSPFDLVIFGSPRESLSDADLGAIEEYVTQGGSVLLTLGDGHGGRYTSMSNALEKRFGVALNEDCVTSTVLHKYLHPKEVAVTRGVTNREINRQAGKTIIGGASTAAAAATGDTSNGNVAARRDQRADPTSLTFVYPYGLTMNVQRPGVPLLSSGFMSFPLNRPVVAAWESPQEAQHNGRMKRGKLMITGSGSMFDDTWIGKEENEKLTTILFDYLLHNFKLNQIDADEPDITDYHHLPDTASLSERLRVAVEGNEDLPRDFMKMFDFSTFKIDTDMIPEVANAYRSLGLKQEPLTLIPPEFQVPLPPRLPAVFDPAHRELPAPALDLFDLDEHFAQERVRLAQLANKCQQPEDLEIFITGAAEIVGVTKKLRSPRNKDPRALLDHVFRQIVQFKKSNQQPTTPHHGGHTPPSADRTANNRSVRVVANGDDRTTAAPFEQNVPWELQLDVNYTQSIISGALQLHSGSSSFPTQSIGIEGNIDVSGTRELPLEWGLMAQSSDGSVMPFVFSGDLAAQNLRGVWECPYTQQRAEFVYPLTE